MTHKQRMLNACRALPNDCVAVAPEFWYYYPARILGVDMIEFCKLPFHLALKTAFEEFDCEGWGIVEAPVPNEQVRDRQTETWVDERTLEIRTVLETPKGALTFAQRLSRDEPAWIVERPIKAPGRDLPAFEAAFLGDRPEDLDAGPLLKAYDEVGDAYLLEVMLGGTFFDFYAPQRAGGFETAVAEFLDPDFIPYLETLRERYQERLVRLACAVCEKTPFESLFLGCTWSSNSLLGPRLWRRWDKPVIRAVADEVHRHGRLLHLHLHGRCMETVADLAEIGVDCVCPFERPPGGDVAGIEGLRAVAERLNGRTTMNGNVHTVETLIRGRPADVRREVREVLEAFRGNPRVIVGTGDQVGRETPEENLQAMIEEVRRA